MEGFKFDRMEISGSLADLGTMLSLLIPLVVINGLNATIALLMIGLFYVGAGLYYKIPIPVQPLKAVAVIAITSSLSAQVIAASGLIMGVLMFVIGTTGLIVQINRVFSKPVIRGVQVGLGFTLFVKAVQYVIGSELFISGESVFLMGVPLNVVVGLIGVLLGALLLTNKKIPAAIVLVLFGFLVGSVFKNYSFTIGPQIPIVQIPTISELQTALVLLVPPQIPVTLSNAVISTSDL
ncbi:MAG: putative sulfate/molybdate transporter [Candidatus Hadarchaeaceae archaeon]